MDQHQITIEYAVTWAIGRVLVAGTVFVCGSLLELDAGSIFGLAWRSAVTGAVFIGAGVLTSELPFTSPLLVFLIQTAALMVCAFVLFRVGFPEEWVYAAGFAIGVNIAVTFAMFGVGVLIDFYTPKG